MKNNNTFIQFILIIFFVIISNSLLSQDKPVITLENFDLNKHYARLGEKVNIHYKLKNHSDIATEALTKIYLSQSPSSYVKLDIIQETNVTISALGEQEGSEEITLPININTGKWFLSFQVVTKENEFQVVEIGNFSYAQVLIYEITVYGSHNCGWTQGMMKDLEYYSMPYYFKDVNKNNKYSNEMWEKLREIGYTKSNINFPVIDVKNNIMIRPKIGKVRKILKS